MSILLISLIIMLIVLFLLYFGYLGILLILGSKRNLGSATLQNKIKSSSIIIATYNEGAVIRAKLEALLSVDKPTEKFEIIVVDSASTDDTCKIASDYNSKGVILLKQDKRMGKANALNYAMSKASGEIIIMSDANSEFPKDSLTKIIKQFDEKTGAVLPRFMPSGKISFWDRFFYAFHHAYKKLESDADSVFIVFGELFAFRKALISHIDERAAADDLEVAVTIRRKQFKVKYSPDIEVYEKIPANKKEVKTQKVRHILGILQVMAKNVDLFWNSRYGTYGLLIYPIHLIQMTIAPILCFLTLGLFIIQIAAIAITFTNPLYLVIVTGALVLALTSLNFASSKAKSILSSIYDVFALQVYILMAFFKLIKKREDFAWEKISSTR